MLENCRDAWDSSHDNSEDSKKDQSDDNKQLEDDFSKRKKLLHHGSVQRSCILMGIHVVMWWGLPWKSYTDRMKFVEVWMKLLALTSQPKISKNSSQYVCWVACWASQGWHSCLPWSEAAYQLRGTRMQGCMHLWKTVLGRRVWLKAVWVSQSQRKRISYQICYLSFL